MAARKVRYVKLEVASRAGAAARILGALEAGGVDLLAFTGFPTRGGKAQVDLVTDDLAGVRRVARREGWKLSAPKRGFLVQGRDQVGAVHRQLRKLAAAGVNVIAADAVTAGQGRYGLILWVKPGDERRATNALGAR